jgi:hypothetical protein
MQLRFVRVTTEGNFKEIGNVVEKKVDDVSEIFRR